MGCLAKFGSLRQDFAGLVDFVTIYIAEAHPAEKGHFSGNYDIDTHRNLGDRLFAAELLLQEAGEDLAECPILVDPMDDPANKAYASFPERFYILLDGKVVFEGGLGPYYYSVPEVAEFLAKWK